MSLAIGISGDREVRRIADAIMTLKERPSSEGLLELDRLLLPQCELRFFIKLPQYEIRNMMEGIHNERLRSLAGGGSSLVINGAASLGEVRRDNLGDHCIVRVSELFFDRAEVYGLEPPIRRFGVGLVVPLGVITGVAIGLADKRRLPS